MTEPCGTQNQPDPEQPLTGGTKEGVVRVGDTVRRPAGPWTPTIDALLRHLESVGFPAPRSRGIDGSGRHVVSWLPGTTTWDEHARHWGRIEALENAARLLRRLHDVLDLFEPPADAYWPGGWGREEGGRTGPICHHDFAPWNLVASALGDLGVIDWDGAGPGDRMAELAGAASSFVPLRRESLRRALGYTDPSASPERITSFVVAYGLPQRRWEGFAEAVIAHARDGVAFGVRMHADGREPFASSWASDQGAGDREDLAATESIVEAWRDGFPA